MSAAPETKVDEVKPIEAPSSAAHTDSTPAAVTTESAAPEVTTGITTETVAPTTTADATTTDNSKPLPAAPLVDKSTETAAVADKVEPVSSGVLGYKAPKLLKQFIFSKRQVWLGDEPVSTQDLNHYLRSTEAKVAHPVAAWSAQTGKGVLYIVKTDADKKNPHDALLLADAVELTKDSTHEFSFKIHGDKHAFKAKDDAERNGWFVAVESAIAEAKTSKESILGSESYKESISHLGKPAALAGGVAAGSAAAATHHKHEEKKEVVAPETTTTPTEPAEEPAAVATPVKDDTKKRTGSRSASRGKRTSIFGALLNKKDEAEHKAEAKKEVKKEEKAADKDKPVEALTSTEVAAASVAGVTGGAVAAAQSETSKAPEDSTTTTDATPVAATGLGPTETTKEETTVTPKPVKRNSIFGSIYQKVRSPTSEKKESEVIPVVPAKEETATTTTPVAATIDGTSDAKPVEPITGTSDIRSEEPALPAALPAATTATTTTSDKTEAAKLESKKERATSPKKEKDSFLGGLFGGLTGRTRSPSSKREAKETEKAEKVVDAPAVPPKDDVVVESTPKATDPALTPSAVPAPATTTTATTTTATDAATPAPATTIDEAFAATAPATHEETPIAPASTPAIPEESAVTGSDTVKSTTPKESRRRSIFGGFGSKKEGESDGEKSGGLAAIFRRPSQAIRNASERREAKKENSAPAESTISETPATTTTADVAKPATTTTAAEDTIAKPDHTPTAIGDVVPEAVTVGDPQHKPQHTSTPTVAATA